MKVALIAPVEETVPPRKYGGTEWIVYHIANGMGKKGHQVDLYASGDSDKEPLYNLIPVVPKSIRTLPEIGSDTKIRETTKLLALVDTIQMLKKQQYDVIHNHASWRFLLFSSFLNQKVVTTHHGPLSADYQNIVFKRNKDHYHVSISNNQRKDLPQLNFVNTIYNGIDLALFPFDENKIPDARSGMIFLARLSPEKGAIEAAKVAHMVKRKLLIAAKVDLVDQSYYEKCKPFIDNVYVTFRGEIGHDERSQLLQSARCLFVPIQWEEPFGLMFTEAMASGTPVITFARGSAPELIKDGETGFLVNSSDDMKRGNWIIKKTGIEGLCEAVERIYAMPEDQYRVMRKACRIHVTNNFTVEKMVDEYEKAYYKVLEKK